MVLYSCTTSPQSIYSSITSWNPVCGNLRSPWPSMEMTARWLPIPSTTSRTMARCGFMNTPSQTSFNLKVYKASSVWLITVLLGVSLFYTNRTGWTCTSQCAQMVWINMTPTTYIWPSSRKSTKCLKVKSRSISATPILIANSRPRLAIPVPMT